MQKEIIFTNNPVMNSRIKQKHLIPFHIDNRDVRYETNRTYYSGYWGECFKVLSVKYSNDGILEECYVCWENERYGMICSDLDVIEDLRLEKDYKEIYKRDIINSDKYYYGAEIIYWFYINGINSLNPKYKNFWIFIDNTSEHRIHDNCKYKLVAKEDKNGNYIGCKMYKKK